MSAHKVQVQWLKDDQAFDYATYTRKHRWIFEGGIEVAASSAPDYKGDADLVDPEEAFTASLSSCHMLTFLAVAAKSRKTVLSYTDNAIGYLEKNDEGIECMTRVTLQPVVVFADDVVVSQEQLTALHEKAHKHCFIANSVNTLVETDLSKQFTERD